MSDNFSERSEGEKESTNGSQYSRHTHYRMDQKLHTSSDTTGALPALSLTNFERGGYTGFDFEGMINALHDLFEQDRQTASQQDATRCGLCYLHYQVNELYYREEGFYVCKNCESVLGNQRVSMLHKQQKL